jgi:predicted AlkP superfamily phosphohydrolase/phosphomutase
MTGETRTERRGTARVRRCAALALALALLAAGCDRSSKRAEPIAPVFLIGIDGLEWSVLHPLIRAGRSPNLAALMQRGSFGKLGTLQPTHSPVIWTSVATGKSRKQHGIFGFLDGDRGVYTSSRRRGRALWNIADLHGLTTHVFGWWVTWPVEPIRGVMVSATSAGGRITKNWKGALLPGIPHQVHPPELTDRVLAIARDAGAPDHVERIAEREVFGPLPRDLDARERDLVDQTLWSIASDETYFEIAKALVPERPADLTMLYFGGPDVAGHRFWRHYRPWEFSWSGSSPAADAALACTVPRYYQWVDRMVGEMVALAGEDATILIVSDHGMHATATSAPNERYTTGDHQDAPPGVLIAAGPGVAKQGGWDAFLERGALPTRGNVYSIAPTVLGLLGIPAARDMEGSLAREILTPAALARIDALCAVDTHDAGFREPERVEAPADREDEFVERMAALGYILVPEAPEDDAVLVDPERFQLQTDPADAHPCY